MAAASIAKVSRRREMRRPDRKSTRLNSSHPSISYAVFCLKKKTCRVYPLSANITTAAFHAGYITSACGITIYEGSALPDEYRGNSFTFEPSGNRGHRSEEH